MKKEESTFVTVFSGEAMEAEMIKQYLEANDIMAVTKNQLMGTIAPWYVSGGGSQPVDVDVMEDNKEAALALIRSFGDGEIDLEDE